MRDETTKWNNMFEILPYIFHAKSLKMFQIKDPFISFIQNIDKETRIGKTVSDSFCILRFISITVLLHNLFTSYEHPYSLYTIASLVVLRRDSLKRPVISPK